MFNKKLSSLEDFTLWLSCAALLFMVAVVTMSVVGRLLFNTPVPDDLLIVGLMMVCVIVLPLAFIERQEGHIVVTVISDFFPERLQHFLAAFGKVLFGIFLGAAGFMLALKVPEEFAQDLYYDGQLEIPTWPMKILFAFGVLVFLIRLASNAWIGFKIAFGQLPSKPLKSEAEH